jgi:hypothetical protein
VAKRVEAIARGVTRPVPVIGGLLRDVVRSRKELVAENTLLRQQLIVAARTVRRPRFTSFERGLFVILARLVPRWRDALLVVKPDTILRWHRDGFRLFWRARSRPPEASAPRVSPETVDLIRRLAGENRLWGAERIRGELLKLGIRVAKRAIQKHMRRLRGPRPWGQSWSTFLKNHLHQTWACDFLQLYDIWFQPIFAFFIIELGSRKVVHVAVTRNPSSTWVAQQLRNATPFGDGPRFLIRDNDDKFGPDFDRVAKGAGVRVLRTAPKAPLMNSFCERFLGSVAANAWTMSSCWVSATSSASCENTASPISIALGLIRGSVSSCHSARRPRRAATERSWPSPCSTVCTTTIGERREQRGGDPINGWVK